MKRFSVLSLIIAFCLSGTGNTVFGTPTDYQVLSEPAPHTQVEPTAVPEISLRSVTSPSFEIAENVSEAMRQQADNVRLSIEETASVLFQPEPLGFSPETFIQLYHDLIGLPVKVPHFAATVAEETRFMGIMGTLLMILFLAGLTYTLVGRKKILQYLESKLLPLTSRVTESLQPYLNLVLKLVASLVVPMVFWIFFWIVQAFTGLNKPWFLLIEHLILVWIVGAGTLLLIGHLFKFRLIPIPEQHAITIYKVLRLIALYTVFVTILFYCAEAFQIRTEYLAMLKVTLSLTVVMATLSLVTRKREVLSLLPELPYTVYRHFRGMLARFYTPAMLGTFLTGVLWSFGYRQLCWFLWIKTWAVAAVIITIGVGYHYLALLIEKLRGRSKGPDDKVEYFYSGLMLSLKFLLIVTLFHTVMSLLGLYDPMIRLISFPIFVVGSTPISIWSFIRALLIIWVFHLLSRVVRGYLDYKVLPVLGIEEGLAYSINTFTGYLLLATGGLFAMHSIGLDLRILLVFAGAIGIGIGFGLQNMAANIISGFFLIFGQKVRKGDWIQVGDALGYVTEVTLQLTKVMTRDNVEYLIPNADLTSNTIVNYSLTEPLIRIHIPVGVSYNADPFTVRHLLLQEARKNDRISQLKHPEVWFSQYGDSSIDFELLVWIDARRISKEQVRSDLYFEIFKALEEAQIEIPYPQRDIHIRSEKNTNL